MPHENPCPPTNTCPACGAAFTCGMQAGLTECWCSALPPLLALPATAAAGCYCPECLARLVEAQQAGKAAKI